MAPSQKIRFWLYLSFTAIGCAVLFIAVRFFPALSRDHFKQPNDAARSERVKSIYRFVLSADESTFLCYSYGGGVYRCDVSTGAIERRFTSGHRKPLSLVAAVDGRTFIVAYENGNVLLWSCDNDRHPPRRLWTLEHPPNCSALSSSGRLIAFGYDDGLLEIRELQSGNLRFTQQSDREGAACVHFFPSGDRLLTAMNSGCILEWNIEDGCCSVHYMRHKRRVRTVAFSGDGRYFVSACTGGTICLWKCGSPQPIWTIDTGKGECSAVAFRADGRQFAVGNGFGEIGIYDVSARRQLTLQKLSQSPLSDLHYSRDGSALFFSTFAGELKRRTIASLIDADSPEK